MPADEPAARWGILGGLFDPFHLGHLSLAKGAQNHLSLDRVLLVPSFHPPHRDDTATASFEIRVAMLELLADDYDWLSVCDIENSIEPPGYTLRVVKALTEKYPDKRLWLIIGTDHLMAFQKWHRWQDLLSLCRLAVGVRPGFSCAMSSELPSDRIDLVDIDQVDLSSTVLRNRLQFERDPNSLRELLPESIADYIVEHGLYR